MLIDLTSTSLHEISRIVDYITSNLDRLDNLSPKQSSQDGESLWLNWNGILSQINHHKNAKNFESRILCISMDGVDGGAYHDVIIVGGGHTCLKLFNNFQHLPCNTYLPTYLAT